MIFIKYTISFLFFSLFFSAEPGDKSQPEIYTLTVYHFKNDSQEMMIDDYLQNVFIPALHKKEFKNIGVFKPLTNDTASDKLIYVFAPLKNLQQIIQINNWMMEKDRDTATGNKYLTSNNETPPYTRMERIVLEAFPLAPQMQLPALHSSAGERIYELRSYESAGENLHFNKVKMFNEGGEISIFKRLGFNAIFYSRVIAGCHMPNLMYMTSFENLQEREAHWKSFSDDEEWKRLSADPQYKNNVSHIDVTLMHPTSYSDF